MSIHLLKTTGVHILCLFMYCFVITAVAQKQNSSIQLDTIAFTKSLEGKPFDEVAHVFYENYGVDSVKASTTIHYIKNHFLQSGTKIVVADSYLIIALWDDKVGNRAQAISMIDKGIFIANDLKNSDLLYKGYLRKGAFLFDAGKNKEALNAFIKALDFAKAQKNIGRQLSASNNIILIKIQVNDNLGAIDLYHENLKIVQENKGKNYQDSELEIYLGLCKAYINLKEYHKATEYCNKGITLSEELNALNFKSYLLSGLGDIAANTGKFDEAHRYFAEAEVIIGEAGGDKNFNLFLRLYFGKTYFLEGKYEEAVAELSKGEALIQTYKVDFLSLQELYYYLAKSYKELGNSEQAIKYYEKAEQINKKNDKKRQEISSNLTTKFDLAKLKEEIDALEAKSKRTKNFYYAGIVLLLFVIIGLLVYTKKQQQKNKKRFTTLMNQLEEKRQQEKLRQEKLQREKESQSKVTVQKESIAETLDTSVGNSEETEINTSEIDSIDVEILKKLVEFEKKELFLSKESTLVEVAKKIHTNTTYLSKVINTHKEKSFTAYITDLRVDYAIERLSHDRKFRSFTIGAIAQEIGFKRSESFSKAFKVKTGLYPSYFVKELEKQQVNGL